MSAWNGVRWGHGWKGTRDGEGMKRRQGDERESGRDKGGGRIVWWTGGMESAGQSRGHTRPQFGCRKVR